MSEFGVDNATKLLEIDNFLNNNAYLSGKSLPGTDDARVLGLLEEAPDRTKYPNLFSWWWNLSPFQEPARALWGESAKGKKKEKKVEKKVEKKEEKKVEEDESDDLFGSDDEDDEEAIMALKEKKMKAEMKNMTKEEKQRSRVTFEVKGFEVGQDFEGLSKRIKKDIQPDGLIWEIPIKVLPLAFGMMKLQMSCKILNSKINTDNVWEMMQEKYPEEIQSIDVTDFQKV